MTITLNALSAAVLSMAINECGTDEELQKEHFLLNNVFRPNPMVHFDENLKWGVDQRGIFLVGYSRPDDAAVAVEKSGQTLKTLRIPRIRRKIPIDREFVKQLSVLVQNYTGPLNMDPMSQLQMKIHREALRLRTMIDRQTEVSAATALAGGTFPVNDEEGNTIGTVDFGYTGNGVLVGDQYTIQKNLSGGDKWDTATSKPSQNLRTLRRQIRRYTGWAGPCYVLAGYNALDLMVTNTDTKDLMDNRRMDMGNLTYTEQSLIRGKVAGMPVVEYDLVYDTADGKVEAWSPNHVMVLPVNPRLYSVEFGPVFDFPGDDPQALPELIHTQYFSKTVRHEDPATADIIAEANPMPVIWNPKAQRRLKVA